jgi:hypothetical protein
VQSVTITESQRLTGFASVSVQAPTGTARFNLDLCYRLQGETDLLTFTNEGEPLYSWATSDLTTPSVGRTKVIGVAGTYEVGLCIYNNSIPVIDIHVVSGFLQVTN